MTAYNTKGTKIKLIPSTASANTITPLTITKAGPAQVSITDVTGITNGDIAVVKSVGFSELNNQIFIVGNVDGGANTFDLIGSDTTNSSGVLAAAPEIEIYSATDGIIVCLSSIEIGASSTGTVDVGTFCDTSATLPGRTTPGTLSLSGFVDKMDEGLAELIKADKDGEARIFYIQLSNDQGYFIGEVIFTGLSFGVPLEGGYSYSVTGTQTSRIKWIHD